MDQFLPLVGVVGIKNFIMYWVVKKKFNFMVLFLHFIFFLLMIKDVIISEFIHFLKIFKDVKKYVQVEKEQNYNLY